MPSNERIKNQYYAELERSCELNLTRRSTFIQRKKAVNYFIKFLSKSNIDLKHLNSQHLHEFLQFLSQKPTNKRKNLAPATIKQIYALVKSFYVQYYEKNGKIKHPDLIFTKNLLQRYKLGERKLPKYIDQEKMKKFLNECPERWKALFHFMYDTGARISEVLNVQFQHLDLKRKQVKIYEPKTMNIRVTTLSNKTIVALQNYFEKYRPSPRTEFKNFAFINQQRRKMSPRAIQYIVKQLSGQILGKENIITPHYFRAACAVHLLEGGVDIRQVQEIIGWKSLTIVQNYTRVTPTRQAELKEQYHPSFREDVTQLERETPTLVESNHVSLFQRQLSEEQHKHKQELGELRKSFQKDMDDLKTERQRYEGIIGELLKSQQEERQGYEQQIKKMFEVQQQLLQLLNQNSAKKT